MLKLANQVIVLDRLNINGRLHRLSRELQITVGHDEDRLTLSNEEFGLLVLSPTLEEGIAGISDELPQCSGKYMLPIIRRTLQEMHYGFVQTLNLLLRPVLVLEELQDPRYRGCSSQERV